MSKGPWSNNNNYDRGDSAGGTLDKDSKEEGEKDEKKDADKKDADKKEDSKDSDKKEGGDDKKDGADEKKDDKKEGGDDAGIAELTGVAIKEDSGKEAENKMK